MTATATKPRPRTRTTKDTKSTKVEPRTFSARSQYASCEITVTPSASGHGYKGRYRITWDNADDKLKDIDREAGLPQTVNATVRGAFDRAVMDACDYVLRVRTDHISDQQLEQIDSLLTVLRDWHYPGDSEASQPIRTSSAMPPVNDPTAATDPRSSTTAKPARQHVSGQTPPRDELETDAEEVVWIPLDKLHDHPGNPDPTPAEVQEMAVWLQTEPQQEPLAVRPMDDPLGHYEVLCGKTRLAAARKLNWSTIECRVRCDLTDDIAAALFAATNNSRRRVETPIRKAAWVRYLIDQGMSTADAGKHFGWSRSFASQMIGLLRLPDVWKERVASGDMPATAAVRLNPYAEQPTLMAAFDGEYRANEWRREQFRDKGTVASAIQGVLKSVTRPVEPNVKHEYGYDLGWSHPRYFKLTPEIEQQLEIVELPLGPNGKMQRVATNAKAYDALQVPLIKERMEKQKAGKSPKTKAAASGAKLSPKEAAAEAKRKRTEADERLGKWIDTEWRPAFLRLCAAQAVRAIESGDWRLRLLYGWLVECVGNGMGCHAWPYQAIAAAAVQSNDRYRPDMDRWRLDQLLAGVDRDGDPVRQCEERDRECLALLLWPRVAEGTPLPEYAFHVSAESPFGKRLPPISNEAIDRVCELLEVKLADGWMLAARGRGSSVATEQRELVAALLDRMTSDQLRDLAIEWIPAGAKRVQIIGTKTKGGLVDGLLGLHAHPHLPKMLESPNKKGRKR